MGITNDGYKKHGRLWQNREYFYTFKYLKYIFFIKSQLYIYIYKYFYFLCWPGLKCKELIEQYRSESLI